MEKEEKLPRRERQKRRQRQEMLAAALELFSQKGYHNVSMNEIAERSEFAIGTLYKFFNNKEDLYNSLMLEHAETFHSALTAALEEGPDEIEKLRNFVRIKGSIFMDKSSVVRLYIAEARSAKFSLTDNIDNEIRKQINVILDMLTEVFTTGIQKKIFRDIAHPHHLAIALDSICSGFLIRWLEDTENNPYPEDPDEILNIFFKGLLN